MPLVESEFAPSRDPRIAAQLADHALGASPAWLWSADGSRILWANAVGAAIFGAADAGDHVQRRFDAKDPAAAEIVRLARTLPASGQARLERLRGFGAGYGRALTCTCTRVALGDGEPAVLITTSERAGPALTLRERVARLLPDHGQALAAFAPDGALLHATAAARTRFGADASLSALALDALSAQALASGTAAGPTRYGPAVIERLRGDTSGILVVTFGAQQSGPVAPESTPQTSASATAVASETPVATPPLAGPTALNATATSPAAPLSPRTAPRDEPPSERRYPLRFVWQMDADGRLVVGSDEFIEIVGPRTTAAFGRLWSEIATELRLDPDNQVARAVATRETWSGITVSWPVDESSERLPVELSGLPVFDRDRSFRGYRGFGVCRDVARINLLARARREHPIGFMRQPEAPREDEREPSPVLQNPDLVEGRPASTVVATQVLPTPEAPVVLEAPVAPVVSETPVPEEAAEAAVTPATPEIPEASEAPAAPPVSVPPEIVPPEEEPRPVAAPAAANVLPFRFSAGEPKAPSLSPVERKAFRELAQELTSRLRGAEETSGPESAAAAAVAAPEADAPVDVPATVPAGEAATQAAHAEATAPEPLPAFEPVLLDRLPVGVLIYRDDQLLYANRCLLQWSGHDSLDALAAAGGLATLFAAPGATALDDGGAARKLAMIAPGGDGFPIEGRLFTVPWSGATAHALVVASGEAERHQETTALALGAAETEIRELKKMLDAAADAAFVLHRDGGIVAATGGAEALFGREASAFVGRSLAELFAPESAPAVRDYFARFMQRAAMFHVPLEPLEVTVLRRGDEAVPLALTLTRVSTDRFCAVLRDATPQKRLEEEMRNARREAEKAAAAKANFLAKVSHELRTPLNAITGFAEVIMAERFGPIANERYREYLKDIHVAGTHLVALLNDLLDLSKVETGQMDLTFGNVSLNELTQQCVGIMQPQASRARIIIRTSLTPGLPQIVADERSLRQIVLNLLSNSIRFTGPGGQVIVSTAFADSGETVLRVRDTGVGMSEKDVEIALQPFRQTATSGSWGSGGTGLGLPLTKALAEANRAHFSIKSAPNAGTLVEVAFPPGRVAAN